MASKPTTNPITVPELHQGGGVSTTGTQPGANQTQVESLPMGRLNKPTGQHVGDGDMGTVVDRIPDYTPPPRQFSTYTGPTFGGGQSSPGSNDPRRWASGSPIGLMDTVGRFNAEGARDAQTREVDENELVRNQIGGLLSGNSRYIRDARLRGQEEAAARGMLTGSIGAGAAERSAIQAALPIASQDAATYGRVYDANLGYQNQFGLAQQNMIGSLIGQEAGIRANLDESERMRSFQAVENELQRAFQGSESALDRALRMSESERDRFLTREQNELLRLFQSEQAALDRTWRSGESALDREFTGTQNQLARDWQSSESQQARAWQAEQTQMERDFSAQQAEISRNWQGSQADLDRMQNRMQQYWQNLWGREGQFAATLASIFENPNLTPQQQQAAAQNARAVFETIWNSTAQTFAQGVPDIFTSPYGMAPGQTVGPPSPGTGSAPPIDPNVPPVGPQQPPGGG
jgi:hypothetical protein